MIRVVLVGIFVLSLVHPSGAQESTTSQRFRKLVQMAQDSGWVKLPLGKLMERLGNQLVGTPYVGGTLEAEGPEACRVTLEGLDCVTFFESVLNLARNLHSGRHSFEDLVASISFTRYRNGVVDGYTSRLHYTTEWISDNITKGIVRDIGSELGARPVGMDVNFMSTHPGLYPALRQKPADVEAMARIEQRVRGLKMMVVDRKDIAGIESRLQDGDIVAIVTSKAGLDYAHTGIVVRDGNRARLMHASSSKKRVILDEYLSDVVQRVDSWTGISVVRPVDRRH